MFNRLLFVVVFLAVWSVTSIAVAQRTTPFDQIKQWYAAGKSVTPQDVRGGHAGRCYDARKPDVPYGAFLLVDSIDRPRDGGPAFPAADPLKLWLELSNPLAYNNLSQQTVESTLTNRWSQMNAVGEVFGTVAAYNPSDRRQFVTVKHWVNQVDPSESYLVLFVEDVVMDVASRKPPVVTCYFFKKIK